MPLFGAHMSISGGLYKAPQAAKAHEMQTFQMFTGSPNQWSVRPRPGGQEGVQFGKHLTKNANQWAARDLTDDDIRTFKRALKDTGLKHPTAHDSYLINLATPDETLYRRSIEAFVVEIQRAEALGLSYLVTHPGAHVGSGEDAGLARVATALDEVHARCAGFKVKVLLETTAGQGSSLGHRFEHLGRILELVKEPRRLGVCLDTCHVFAAGYPLSPEADYLATMKAFDDLIGLKRLRVFHVNDSVKGLGCRVDRHANVGQGMLGLEPFRLLVNDPRFADRPMILETPKEDADGADMDIVNMNVLRGLVKAAS